jgi:hypothetical protein
MNEVRRAAIVIGVVVAVFAAAAIWLLRPGPSEGVRRSTRGAVDPFDARGRIDSAADRVIFNPLGTRVAVLGGRGLAVAEAGRARYLFDQTTNIVDAAWLPGTTKLLVAEGPALTGRLSIVGIDGQPSGYVAIQPSFGVGTGHGMTVDEGRHVAVVTATQRESLGGEHLYLVAVELSSGATHSLTPADGPDELAPAFAGMGAVVYTARTEGDSWVGAVDVATGAERRLSPPGERATSRGVIGDRHAVYTTAGGKVWAVPVTGGTPDLLVTLSSADVLVGVDPTGGRAVVAREGADGVELVAITIKKPS